MFQFSSVEEAAAALCRGEVIIVTDDESRENEGDFICAAEFATTANVNLMASVGRGLICMPMEGAVADALSLPPMVAKNTDNHETAFTVSIDHISTTTGISAVERGVTARMAAAAAAAPDEFRRPGHMFPLRAKNGGVLERDGHTEATVDLMKIAGLTPVGLCCEIMAEDGTMMRTPELIRLAEERKLVFTTIAAIQKYRVDQKRCTVGMCAAQKPEEYA